MHVSLSHFLATIRHTCNAQRTHSVAHTHTHNARVGGRKGKNILNHLADGGRQKNTSAIVSALFVHLLFVRRLIIYFSLSRRLAANFSAMSHAQRGYTHLDGRHISFCIYQTLNWLPQTNAYATDVLQSFQVEARIRWHVEKAPPSPQQLK